MHARLTVFLPEQAALSHVLRDGERLQIGRGEDCGLCVAHPSVSRLHAEIAQDGDGTWVLGDRGSKNGSHVDGKVVAEASLPGDAWLRFGDVYCEFELVDAARSARIADQQQARRARATALTLGLQRAAGFSALLDGTLQAVMELGHCTRGFLLLRDDDGGFAIRACQAIDPTLLAHRRFSGSAGAVERVLREGEAVVANDVGSEAWLAARDSVVAGGLRALVCLPLRDAGGTLGAIYADRTTAGPAITRLDLELLEAFAERAALYISAQRASDALVGAPRWAPAAAGIAAP
ncbi:GAF domain-containing protein [Luteimonas vadosa]|uniref:FHA domain-containing protein n=1 Tax=Luteimonas vadosa TaxID=1165507 RepID=A0ABP9DMB4_9GAMM